MNHVARKYYCAIFAAIGLVFQFGCDQTAHGTDSTLISAEKLSAIVEARPTESEISQLTDSLHTHIKREITAGFDSQKEIIANALEFLKNSSNEKFKLEKPEIEKLVHPIAEQIVTELFAAHREEQKNWPLVTDCDRLDQAFAELESRGLVAQQNFRTEGSCGILKLCEEIQATQFERKTVRGFVYYYSLDTENAVEGRGLFLSFGSLEDDPASASNIGTQIVAVLSHHGLMTEWNEGREQRINVKMDWKRRR